MKIIVYPTVNQFLQENRPILLKQESASQLLLHNALIRQEETTNELVLFGKVIDDNQETVLIFCNVLPYNMVIHAVKSESDDMLEAVKVLAEYIHTKKIILKGINACKSICDMFILQYRGKFKEHLAMDIMELRKLNELQLPTGMTRKANKSDCRQIAQWIVEFAKEALGEDIQYEDQILKAERMIDAGIVYIYVNSLSEIVSMAAATRKLVNGTCINSVYTPKKYRGRGYAAANMYYMSKELLERGNQFCTLFVDKHNPISNRVYKKVGYKIVENQYDYRLV